MAGTINYAFSPNETVYVIIPCDLTAIVNTLTSKDIRVSEGVIIRVNAEVISTTVPGEEVEYDIRISGSPGTVPVLPRDTFATLTLATDEYELRLT